jgi:hypothetical protein
MYHESNGTLRWFAVLGALAGMFFYRKIVSPLFVKYAALLLAKLLGLLKRLLKWLWKPFGFAGRKTHKTADEENVPGRKITVDVFRESI